MFTIAIIGRPNVGKSTLFNRLVGRKLALVDDRPGVTRDRREGEGKLGDLRFTVVDTAGLEEGDAASLPGRTRAQTEAAIEAADGLFFVVDARVGLTPDDRAFAALVRRAGKPLILIANKAEGRAGGDGAMEAYQLGLGDPIPLSAEHGDGFSELYAAMLEALPEQTALVEEEMVEAVRTFDDEEDGSELDTAKPLRIAVIGRPNAGKSTLLNKIIGAERLLVGPEAGLTRDSISVDVAWRGRDLKMFDTAGLRRRAKVEDKLEKLAGADGLRAAKFAEVVILLIDATTPFEKQDLTLADLVAREGRALVIGVNKWDLVEDKAAKLHFLREEAVRLLPQVKGIATARLNRWLTATLEHHPPPAIQGRRIKIRYMTQLRARPPYFVIFGNQLTALPTSYERFLVNGIREAFALPGVPIRISRKTSDNPYEHRKSRQR